MQFSKLTVISLSLLIPSISASFSLATLDPLPDDQVTLGCLNAYNADIKSCSSTQISSGNCNALCEKDLEEHSKKVILACRQAFVGMDTLLRRVIDGGLVTTLCNGKPKEVPGDGQNDEEEEEAPVEEDKEEEELAPTSIVFSDSIAAPSATAITDIEVDDTPFSTPANIGSEPTETPESNTEEEEEEEDDTTNAGGDPFSSNSVDQDAEEGDEDSSAGRFGFSATTMGVVAVVIGALVM